MGYFCQESRHLPGIPPEFSPRGPLGVLPRISPGIFAEIVAGVHPEIPLGTITRHEKR